MKITVDESAYSKSFEKVLYSHDRYIIAYGGRGSSKTDTFYLKYLLELFQPYYFKLAYVNKEKANIRDQQYAGFKRVAKRIGLFDSLKFYDGDYRIVNPQNGNAMIPKGMDDPEKTKGLDDITAIWWDEINKGTEEDFTTLNALLRSPAAEYLQFAISFNPVSETSWLRKYFFDENNAYTLNDNFKGIAYLHHSTFRDNEFIDQNAYHDTLLQNSHGNVNRANVDIKGLWGVNTVDNPFFYSYNTTRHYKTVNIEPNRNITLDISFDFNIDPCTAVIGQYDRVNFKFVVFDVITANPQTMQGKSPLESVCAMVQRKYISSGLFTKDKIRITGDASGKYGTADNVINRSFYTTIKRELSLYDSQVILRSMNTPHQFSGEVINYFLRYCDFYHNNNQLDNDITIAFNDGKDTLNEAKKKHGLHILDAWRYLIDYWVCHLGGWTNDYSRIRGAIDLNIKKYVG